MLCVAVALPVYADELSDAKQRANDIQQQLNESQSKVNALKESQYSLSEYMSAADAQINDIQSVINDYKTQSEEKEKRIKELEVQIDEKEEEIALEYQSMQKRIQFLYENLNNSYLDAFFSSDNFADAINKISYLLELTNYDRKQMNKLKEMKADIETTKEAIEDQQKEIKKLQTAQEDEQKVIQQLYEAKAAELETTEGQLAMEEALSTSLQQELAGAESEIAAAVAMFEEQAGGGDDSGDSGGGDDGGAIGTSGQFCFPLPGEYYSWWYVTSPYGYRINPITGYGGENHSGMDIGVPYGTPIYACDSGTVVWSAWSDSAGNYTVIYHGNGIYTEYMHQCERIVYNGQWVERGQTIGYVGSTGWSTGPHLHLGVIIDYSGSFLSYNRVDPAPYIGMG